MPNIESSFQKMINETRFLISFNFSGFYFPLFKYTTELLYDGYSIPDKYITTENRILHQYPKIYKKLAERDNLELIEKLLKLDRNGIAGKNINHVMKGAAKAGNIKILKWCIKNNYALHKSTTASAVKGNQLEPLKWLVKNCKINSYDIECALKKGNMEIFEYLVTIKPNINKLCNIIARHGHFDIIKDCYSNGASINDIACGAASGGHLDILKFAYAHGGQLYKYFTCKHTHIFEWLIQNNYFQYNKQIVANVASSGNLDCLQFIYSKGFNILHKIVFESAVLGRNIEMITWLHNINCPVDVEAINMTIFTPYKKHFTSSPTILKLLLSWNCPVSKNACTAAASDGDLEILKILHEHDCMIDDRIINKAAINGHLHVIIWALEHGCVWNTNTCRNTIVWNLLEVLKWLRGIDRDKCDLKSNETKICPWNRSVYLNAIVNNKFDVLKFAFENDCKFDATCYNAAMKSNDKYIVNFVKKNYRYGK